MHFYAIGKEYAVFGYVKPVIGELLVKEHEFYRATYCGVCRAMKAKTGALSNVLHSYDSVFLALIRMLFVDDGEISAKKARCIAHPIKSRPMLVENSALDYTARAFAILTYYKLCDDLADERRFGKRAVSVALRPIFKGAKNKADLKSIADITHTGLAQISELEAARCESVDKPAGLFGEILGAIFAQGLSDTDSRICYQIGYHLGKFIYAADAAEDYERDRKNGSYNPFVICYGGQPLTDENRRNIKCALLLECRELELAVNLLPFGNKVTAENIIKNIIYLGLPKRIEFLDGKGAEDERTVNEEH